MAERGSGAQHDLRGGDTGGAGDVALSHGVGAQWGPRGGYLGRAGSNRTQGAGVPVGRVCGCVTRSWCSAGPEG
jgi:hypothetical protein